MMTNLEIFCLACSAGKSLALTSMVVMAGLSASKHDYAFLAFALLFVIGAGSCSIEDRVCEIAHHGS